MGLLSEEQKKTLQKTMIKQSKLGDFQ